MAVVLPVAAGPVTIRPRRALSWWRLSRTSRRPVAQAVLVVAGALDRVELLALGVREQCWWGWDVVDEPAPALLGGQRRVDRRIGRLSGRAHGTPHRVSSRPGGRRRRTAPPGRGPVGLGRRRLPPRPRPHLRAVGAVEVAAPRQCGCGWRSAGRLAGRCPRGGAGPPARWPPWSRPGRRRRWRRQDAGHTAR